MTSPALQSVFIWSGAHQSHPKQCYIMCCCSSSGPGQCAHAQSSRAAQSPVSCAGCGERADRGQLSSDTERVHTVRSQARGLQPLSSDTRHEGQSREPGPESRVQSSAQPGHVPRVDDSSESNNNSASGQTECSACSDMVRLETSGGQWYGVSGVPGLGVSIPRSLSSGRPVSSLSEWDSHETRERRSNSDNRRASVHGIKGLRDSEASSSKVSPLSLVSGVKVDIPRVFSPRSSECRSSGRSTGSRGSSAISQNLSHGSSSSSSKYSNRLVAPPRNP